MILPSTDPHPTGGGNGIIGLAPYGLANNVSGILT